MGSDNPAIIIIEGSWEPNGNNMTVERGFDFYVIDGGEIVIPDEHTFTLVPVSYTHLLQKKSKFNRQIVNKKMKAILIRLFNHEELTLSLIHISSMGFRPA